MFSEIVCEKVYGWFCGKVWYDGSMEKRKSNTSKTKTGVGVKKVMVGRKSGVGGAKKTVRTKAVGSRVAGVASAKGLVAKKSVASKKTSVSGAKKAAIGSVKILAVVSGVLNIVACLVMGILKKQLWGMKFELWEVLLGVLVFALLIWVNMSHISHVKKEKEKISNASMNVFGSAKLVVFWSMLNMLIIMGLGQVMLPREFMRIFEIGTLSVVVLGMIIMILMHYAMMRDLKMRWGMGLYAWIFIWGFLSTVLYYASSVGKLCGYEFDLWIIKQSIIEGGIFAITAGVIGEVYKKAIGKGL